jgi:hypothetical protein
MDGAAPSARISALCCSAYLTTNRTPKREREHQGREITIYTGNRDRIQRVNCPRDEVAAARRACSASGRAPMNGRDGAEARADRSQATADGKLRHPVTASRRQEPATCGEIGAASCHSSFALPLCRKAIGKWRSPLDG